MLQSAGSQRAGHNGVTFTMVSVAPQPVGSSRSGIEPTSPVLAVDSLYHLPCYGGLKVAVV